MRTERSTAILGAWHLWGPVAKALGTQRAATSHFLDLLINIYDGAGGAGPQTDPKHLKLYHRSFVLNLIARFGTKVINKKYTLPGSSTIGIYLANKSALCGRRGSRLSALRVDVLHIRGCVSGKS